MVSDLQWETLQPVLKRTRVPLKAADPAGTGLIAYNGADW